MSGFVIASPGNEAMFVAAQTLLLPCRYAGDGDRCRDLEGDSDPAWSDWVFQRQAALRMAEET